MRRRALLAAALAALPPARRAAAQKGGELLRLAWRDAIPNLDPYYNSLRTGLVLAHHAWDTLIHRDPETFQLKPLLAASWRYVGDTAIEFQLRPGVTFHDGSAFGADDVAYTVETVLRDPKVAVPSNYAFLDGAERLDELRVRLRLKRVFPAALEYIAMVLPIWPQAYRERVGAEAYARAPVGTGPYRITRVEGATRIELERNEAYFDGPKGRPAIRYITVDEVPDAAAEITALFDGRADWIWMFDPERIEAINREPALQALRAESMRVGYLCLDAAGRSDPTNPFGDLRVRQAVMHAVDRQAMVRQLVQGGARVLDAPCYPTQFGCDQKAAVRWDYDPARARALLAQAGYPDGFATELVSYVLPAWSEAVRSYLRAVGIEARLAQLPTAEALDRITAGRAPLVLGGWGSFSINDVSAFLPHFFTGGDEDYARDPEVQRLVEEGGSVTNPDRRRAAYSAAIRRITEQAYWLPLYTYATTYAFARGLNFRPYPDELPRFYLASWK